ncbi:MAG: phosphotransferase, partial [Nocardioides sp.]
MTGHRVPVAVQGWDSEAFVVDGRWLERVPRRPEVRTWLEAEARLMPRLAPLLPLDVPVPVVIDTDPWRVRHELVPGEPVERDRLAAPDGRRVGEFLRALHDVPPATWSGTGIAADTDRVPELEAMRTAVLPLLPSDLTDEGEALLDRCAAATRRPVLRHGDLGPDHLLTTGGRITGVIDWTDTALGDPALDLAWLVHRTPARFADALVAAYGPTPEELDRG